MRSTKTCDVSGCRSWTHMWSVSELYSKRIEAHHCIWPSLAHTGATPNRRRLEWRSTPHAHASESASSGRQWRYQENLNIVCILVDQARYSTLCGAKRISCQIVPRLKSLSKKKMAPDRCAHMEQQGTVVPQKSVLKVTLWVCDCTTPALSLGSFAFTIAGENTPQS